MQSKQRFDIGTLENCGAEEEGGIEGPHRGIPKKGICEKEVIVVLMRREPKRTEF